MIKLFCFDQINGLHETYYNILNIKLDILKFKIYLLKYLLKYFINIFIRNLNIINLN